MDMIFSGATCDSMINEEPLLTANERRNERDHIITMSSNEESSSSSLTNEETQSASPRNSLPSQSLSREASSNRNGNNFNSFQRIMLSSTVWLCIEFLYTVCQVVASVIVLILSKDENPHAPLSIWVLGYAAACTVTLPVIYWRFRSRNERYLRESLGSYEDPGENSAVSSSSSNNRASISLITWVNGLMENLKVALDCFFALWFIVGNVWIFGGHSSPSDAPKLYKLCIVFLTFSCIGYAMPFILCTTLCCCMPCIVSIFGLNESAIKGATEEAINSLPICKFKDGRACEREAEDATCCICLSKYVEEEDLRELPCHHMFHVQCVDKWLKMNASCPLCKYVICEKVN